MCIRDSVVFKPFTQNIPWMVYGCLLLINIIQNRTRIIERIACFCMIKTGGTYNGIIYGLIILGIIINIVVPGVFTSMAVCVLAYGICEALNLGKIRASSGIMLAAIVGFIEAWTFVFCPPDLGVLIGIATVSYTHLDVYKRQMLRLTPPHHQLPPAVIVQPSKVAGENAEEGMAAGVLEPIGT